LEWRLGDSLGLIGRPQEALLCAKAKRQQMFYLCESEAAATTTTKHPAGMEINTSLCKEPYFINDTLNFIGIIAFQYMKRAHRK